MNEMNFTNLQKRYFNKNDSRYDVNKILNPPVHTILEVNSLLSELPKKCKKVIDFGSGNGRLTIPLLRKSYIVSAVDISEKSLTDLKKIAGKRKRRLRMFTSLSRAGKADAIVGCDVLHHVDLSRELPRIYSHLVTQGKIVFSEPNVLNPSWVIYITLKNIWKYEKKIIHSSYFGYKRAFTKYGFKGVKIIGLGLFPRAFFGSEYLCRLNDRMGNLSFFKIFAYRYIIVAEKK